MTTAQVVRHRAGVLGSPIAHSLSPVLHNAAYRALGLTDWHYDGVEVGSDAFVAHIAGLDAAWRGLSLTMPLKEVAFEVATRASEVARTTGAINTLVRSVDGWAGDNTDVHGIVQALREVGVGSVRSAVIVGSGATARSAAAAAARLGACEVTFMVRAAARPSTVAAAQDLGLQVRQAPLGLWPSYVELVVNTTPPEATAELSTRLPDGGGVLLDVVYGSGVTALMTIARDKGYAVVSGTEMLLHQAGEQVRLMTGEPPPLEAMRRALAAALAARAAPDRP